MKLRIKILLIVIAVLVGFFIFAYAFISFKGKAIVTRQLANITRKKVSIGYFGISPLFNLTIKNLEVEGLAKAGYISVSPSILGFLTGNIALNEVKIVKPEFTYEKTSTKPIALPTTTAPSSAATLDRTKSRSLRLIIKRINIRDGRLNFIDRTIGVEGLRVTIKDINFNLTNLYIFPRSIITNFELKGKIPWQEGAEQGKIEAEGWINLFKKDMQATLKIEDIDGVALYPYYSNWVDLEKARIEKAKLNFSSDIQGLNNNVIADCHLELTDIVRKPRPPDESQEKTERITDVVLDIFRALNQGKIVLNFTIKTKMDRPEFGFGDIKMAFEDKIAKATQTDKFSVEAILSLPANIVRGTIKGATDLSKAVVDGALSVGKELKKVVEEKFKKEKKE